MPSVLLGRVGDSGTFQRMSNTCRAACQVLGRKAASAHALSSVTPRCHCTPRNRSDGGDLGSTRGQAGARPTLAPPDASPLRELGKRASPAGGADSRFPGEETETRRGYVRCSRSGEAGMRTQETPGSSLQPAQWTALTLPPLPGPAFLSRALEQAVPSALMLIVPSRIPQRDVTAALGRLCPGLSWPPEGRGRPAPEHGLRALRAGWIVTECMQLTLKPKTLHGEASWVEQ